MCFSYRKTPFYYKSGKINDKVMQVFQPCFNNLALMLANIKICHTVIRKKKKVIRIPCVYIYSICTIYIYIYICSDNYFGIIKALYPALDGFWLL